MKLFYHSKLFWIKLKEKPKNRCDKEIQKQICKTVSIVDTEFLEINYMKVSTAKENFGEHS